MCTRVETRSGQLGHVLFGSSWSDLVYKISRSDLESNLDHMRSIMLSDPKELCILDGDNGSVSPDCPQAIWRN